MARGRPAIAALDTPPRRRVILILSDGKDSGPISFKQRYVSQMEVIEHARREGVMIYAIGMRSRGGQPRMPALGPAGLQAMLTEDLPDPGIARVAEETGGGYTEIRFDRISARPSRASPTNCTANTCSATRCRSATARHTRSRSA